MIFCLLKGHLHRKEIVARRFVMGGMRTIAEGPSFRLPTTTEADPLLSVRPLLQQVFDVLDRKLRTGVGEW